MSEQVEALQEVAVLFSILRSDKEDEEGSLSELASLVETANGTVAATVLQKRDRPEPGTYFGIGKLEEVKQLMLEKDANVAICNDELTPSQLRRLQDILETKVIDRTQLILDIFAQRARSKEGKLQVELAQLNYMLPRLSGMGAAMSRLGAGIGTRGPGETKLESDRRHIRRRIRDIGRKLEEVVAHRERYRQRRKQQQTFQLALVGYTNAGKSTLFTQLTSQETLAEDKLFATLDPLTKKSTFPSGFQTVVTDTVGFIRDLPTTVVASFRSTLEEAGEADALLFVVDASDPERLEQEKTVLSLLEKLGLDQIPCFTVYNKIDRVQKEDVYPLIKPCAFVSALDKDGVQTLKTDIEAWLTSWFTPFSADVEAGDGKRLEQLRLQSITEKPVFNDETNIYEVAGVKPPQQE
ncbi:GTPase HflX [Aureibacillus halotolerans]|uniref:GTPase HflX n=1 Tax=Aureibacillus halotolerans TaxID=1508390 RepID=A0A4R6U0D8_9BACI|nr:GTPase HflX [Aureibacillus halotolerans]TDQ39730.1 GTP-binding protein HflX [Aureibacillus halotolerans]